MSYGDYPPYVSVAERARISQKKIESYRKRGRKMSPVEVNGRVIATSFWGKAWCDNLEAYSDISNRLPRGKSYLRSGAVIDLQVEKGQVKALVSGSSVYNIVVKIRSLAPQKWQSIKKTSGQSIGSVVELLQGRLSNAVMTVVTNPKEGLFPALSEIDMSCDCPDYAVVCKHVAAALFGVGARFDASPELLFLLRGVDHLELVNHAVGGALNQKLAGKQEVFDHESLENIFGIEIDTGNSTAGLNEPKPKPKKKAKPKLKPKPIKKVSTKKSLALKKKKAKK